MADPFDLDALKTKIETERSRPVTFAGKTFHLVPPELMSDDDYAKFVAADEDDMLALAPLILDDYAGFVAVGGSAVLLAQAIKAISDEPPAPGDEGSTPGEDAAS